MKNTKIYTYTIPANGSVQILTEGTYFRILNSTGLVEVDADTYGNILVLAGQGVKDQPFKRLFVNDKSGSLNNVSLVVSDGSFVDDRITGSVEVIDGGKNRTNALQCFLGHVGCPALAGNMAHTQLWNPTGSEKNIVVSSLICSSNLATTFYIGSLGVRLTNHLGYAANKKISAPDSNAMLCVQNNVAGFDKNFNAFNVEAMQVLTLNMDEPIVIPEGQGLLIRSITLGSHCAANFEFYEESNL